MPGRPTSGWTAATAWARCCSSAGCSAPRSCRCGGGSPARRPPAITDPHITDALLREIQPGDFLRVTGTLHQPTEGTPARLTVDALEVLNAAPAPVLYDLVLERWGNYATIFNADRDSVPVFTVDGKWIGEAPTPDAILDLIDAFENGTAR
ncbi:hypothetical protein ACIQWN_34310 [Streptomyces vinaceus]|uniref:hypothetical protein n=1 Tax=Streptomyces vinaceus TaxID=1960 RepID=UPI0038248233